jgi:hypothetical protein
MFNNQSQSAKMNESAMDIKHAYACAVQNFLAFFLLFLSFEQVATESK